MFNDAIFKELNRPDRYRKDCLFCISVVGTPVQLGLCSAGMALKEVKVIPLCPNDCIDYQEDMKG
jgi:hypothetical protein